MSNLKERVTGVREFTEAVNARGREQRDRSPRPLATTGEAFFVISLLWRRTESSFLRGGPRKLNSLFHSVLHCPT